MSYAEKEKSEFAKTLHYAVQADHWTIGLVRDFGPTGATFCGVALRDKDGAILWRKDTPWYVKGDAAAREHKARTFAGTIIANFESGHQFHVRILEDGKPVPYWPDKPERSAKFTSEGQA